MALERLHAGLVLVVPDLDELVVGARDEVRLVAGERVLDGVDALLVALEREVRIGRIEAPDLDSAVERRRGERVGVLGVDSDLHDVVRVTLEDHRVGPAFRPVPQLDRHVVRRRQHVRLHRMHNNAANVVGVRLPLLQLLHRVVVVCTKTHVIGTGNDPAFTSNEFCTTNF
jgi:hypothetical protein